MRLRPPFGAVVIPPQAVCRQSLLSLVRAPCKAGADLSPALLSHPGSDMAQQVGVTHQ